MNLDGLDWQTIHLPFAAGLDTKRHPHAIDPPGLTAALNVEPDETGALRLRKPFASVGTNIYGGGTLSNVRKVAVVDDELLCFTSTALYSWSETLTAWVYRDAHLAIKVEETTRFSNPYDQAFADRAQLSGVEVMTWVEVVGATATAYVAALDVTTRATLIAPTSLGSGNTRPRVVAGSAKIFVFWTDAGVGLVVKTIDPTAPTFAASGATAVTSNEGPYDVVWWSGESAVAGAVTAVGGASYRAFTVTEALIATTSNKARTANQIAVAVIPGAGTMQVIRAVTASTAILGDRLDDSLADVAVGTAIGTFGATCSQIACAFRSVTDGGFNRCYAFWIEDTLTTTIFAGGDIKYNWVDTNSATGTEDYFVRNLTLASRAFDHNGSVYVWTAFAGTNAVSATGITAVRELGVRSQLQNGYYLYRDDLYVATKATWLRGGGTPYYTNHLPGVALISGTTVYAWAGCERQIIALGGTDNSDYSDRAPRDIVFTFDSDDARRTIQIGRTLYVSGGMLLQYDGEALTEVGFNQYPWRLVFTVSAGVGFLSAGDYSYLATLRWDNARGETERSTTAIGGTVTAIALDQVNVEVVVTHVTRKTGSLREPAIEVWRTDLNPHPGAPFYLVTSRDPAATGDNGYVVNDVGVRSMILGGDVLTDAAVVQKEQNPENNGTLPRVAPPGATILAASDTRLFLAGVPGEPNRFWYSLHRSDNEIVGFNGALSYSLPAATGAITGLAVTGQTLVAFTASAIYVIPGDGFDNTGGGGNYGTARLISSDVGALSHDTIATIPGGLIFFSRKGWYRLSSGWDLEYIGAKVEDYNTDAWVAAQVVESQHQVRLLSSSRMLVFDYLVGEWFEWSQSGGKDLAMWRATPVLLDATAPKKEQSTFSAVDYYMEIETGWIKPAGLQGFARVRKIMVLGQYKADHAQQIKIGFDYTAAYTDDKTLEFFTLTAGDKTQLRMGPSRQRIEAIRVRVKIVPAASGLVIPLTYDPVTLTGLSLEVGLRRGLYPKIASTYKQ